MQADQRRGRSGWRNGALRAEDADSGGSAAVRVLLLWSTSPRNSASPGWSDIVRVLLLRGSSSSSSSSHACPSGSFPVRVLLLSSSSPIRRRRGCGTSSGRSATTDSYGHSSSNSLHRCVFRLHDPVILSRPEGLSWGCTPDRSHTVHGSNVRPAVQQLLRKARET